MTPVHLDSPRTPPQRVSTPLHPDFSFFDDPQTRAAAYVVAAVALGVFATIYGNLLVGLWVGGLSTVSLIRDITLTIQDLRSSPVEETASKILYLTQRVFMYGLIWGVMLSGMSLALSLEGTALLLKGSLVKSPLLLLQSLNRFAGVAAFWWPVSQLLLNRSDQFFYPTKDGESLSAAIQQWVGVIVKTIQEKSVIPIWSQMALDTNFLSYLSIDMTQDKVRSQLPELSNVQIKSLIERYPYVLNIEFLQTSLSPKQFLEIVSLKPPFTSADVKKLAEQIAFLEAELPKLERQLKETRRRRIKLEILQTYAWYSSMVSQYENALTAIHGWQLKLPASNKKLQPFITQIDELAREMAPFRSKLEMVRTYFSEPGEDLVAILKETAGFRDFDFRSLKSLFPCDKPINTLLAERGLHTLRDLQFFGIIASDNLVEAVLERLRNYLNHPKIPAASDRPPVGKLDFVPWETIAQRVKIAANYIFYYGFTLSLLGMQYLYYPFATTFGLGYGLLRAKRFTSLEKLASWETVPDFTGQTVRERCQFIFTRTSATLTSFRYGIPGAFLTGIYLGDTLRHYAGPHLARLKNLITEHSSAEPVQT